MNQLAKSIVDAATTDNIEIPPEKNKAAVELGRLGGLKGGKARAAKLSAKKRSEIAIKAARVRWQISASQENSNEPKKKKKSAATKTRRAST